MNIVTGCSGIDAIAYAAMLLDIDVIGQIEIDDFCNKILELRYPGVKRLKNVFDVRGDEFGTVDIFAFGDPCQPHSVAGKREGVADDRYIWPEIFRIIQTMRPTWVLNENVVGSVSNGVVRDKTLQLESEGYRARVYTIPACAVGAPHQRERVFIVAFTTGTQCGRGAEKQRVLREVFGNKPELYYPNGPSEALQTVGYTEGDGCGPRRPESTGQQRELCLASASGEAVADTKRELLNRKMRTWAGRDGYSDSSTDVADTQGEQAGGIQQRYLSPDTSTGGNRGKKASCWPTQSRLGRNTNGFPSGLHEPGGYEDGSGIYGAFEAIFTATLGQICWPAGYGAQQYDYEPPRVATGVKNRTNRLKALGNSIVWPQIFGFLLAIKLIHGANLPELCGGLQNTEMGW